MVKTRIFEIPNNGSIPLRCLLNNKVTLWYKYKLRLYKSYIWKFNLPLLFFFTISNPLIMRDEDEIKKIYKNIRCNLGYL